MYTQKIKIAYIHFIQKPIFILRIKTGLYRKNLTLKPNYFLDSNNFSDNQFKSSLLEIQSEAKIIEEANLILQHKFQTLGSELTHFGEKINWQQDFKSGRIWNKCFYTNINSKESINGSDIKVPWELSRFHQAQYLAKAYIVSKDERYANIFFEMITDWIDENPFCYGVNWNCAMEVAIRAVNWIFALHIFRKSPFFTEELKKKIYTSLYHHGIFIKNNLEYGRRNGNHYLSDLMGLIWIGLFFNKHWFGKRWFNFAKKQLEKEILIQVFEDGVDYEKSTFYQRLVTEIFTLSLIAAERSGKSFSQKFKERLHKMFEFIASYVQGDEVPNIGDCDDGRIIKFNFFEKVSEMRNLLSLGSVIFNDEILKSKAEKNFCDVLLLLGLDGLKKYSELNIVEFPINHQIFHKGGFAVLRTNNFFIFFDFGDIGMNGWGGHGHNDILSFELAYKGIRFFVDSGTYVYTPNPDLRQKFRSTSAHNTIMVDETEQAEFLDLFRIKEDHSKARLISLKLNDKEIDSVEAEHRCYTRLKNPVIVRRKIIIDKSKEIIMIEDSFIGNGNNKIEIFYHFHPLIKIEKIANNVFELKFKESILKLEFPKFEHFKAEIQEGLYSKSYGIIEKNKVLKVVLEKKKGLPKSFNVLIKPVNN